MRLIVLKLAAIAASWIAGGCMAPISADEKDTGGDVVVPDPPRDDSPAAGSSVTVALPADQFAMLAGWLGHENTLTIEKPVHVEQANVTLDAKGGTTFSYTMSDDSGTFTFQRPFPTVKAGFAKLIGGVALHDIVLNADGSGVAATGLGKYRFRWLEDDSQQAAETKSLPEVWAYSMAGCVPCVRAKLELKDAKDLPFTVVWKDESAPDWLQSRPAFWWHTTGDQPSQKDVANTRQFQGWNGLKDFVERWKLSRKPERFIRAQASASPPFVRPDRTDIGSRSVAHWSINGDFTPSRSVLLSHLSNDGIHRGRHDPTWLASLTTEQLRWLHDRDHGT